MWWEVPGYELTSDEALLFGDRVEEPVQAKAPDATMEEPQLVKSSLSPRCWMQPREAATTRCISATETPDICCEIKCEHFILSLYQLYKRT